MPDDRIPPVSPALPDEPLRIVQVVNVRWFNATAWYALFLSRLLREAGHRVRVLGLDGTESFAKAQAWGLEPEALPLNSKNPLDYPGLFFRLRALVREFRPHVVNCHRGESFVLWAALRRMDPSFVLVRTRGDQRPPKANFANALTHASLADAVICTSTGIADAVHTRLAVPARKLHTIRGGVDTRVFYPDRAGRDAVRAAWGLSPEHLVVGLVGRFDTVKGQRELIVAFARLLREAGEETRPRLRLALAGFSTTAVPEKAVRARAEEAGVMDRVIWPGRCPDVRAMMSALDLGVVASLGSETIARVALEIMACGVPLVGTRVGVMPDLLSEQALVPPGNIPAMAVLLRRFAEDASFAPALRGEQARRMADLTERDFYARTLAVYRDALRAAAGGRPPLAGNRFSR